MLIIEVREVKRLSKKVRTKYMAIKPGFSWHTDLTNGERVLIAADNVNQFPIYVGTK